jgi:hypothetical protein
MFQWLHGDGVEFACYRRSREREREVDGEFFSVCDARCNRKESCEQSLENVMMMMMILMIHKSLPSKKFSAIRIEFMSRENGESRGKNVNK